MQRTSKLPLRLRARFVFAALCAAMGAPEASASAQAIAQGVSVFLEGSGDEGDVKVFDEAGVLAPHFPAALQGIELLPIDFTGRTEIEEFLPGRPRWFADAGDTSRLALPHEQGSLYRYRRDGASSSAFGFMLVPANGVARAVWERAGAGSGGDEDPFVSHIAVAPSGTAVMIATTLAAGGDLLELDLASGAVLTRTAELPPIELGPAGFALADEWAVAAASSGYLRFERASAGDAQLVPFASAPPAWIALELALSGNRQHAAGIAGVDATNAHVYVFGRTGSAVRVNDEPMHIASAGYLPMHVDGPRLAVSNDGSRAAWVKLEPTSSEAFIAHVPTVASTPAVQITDDTRFADYLDEIGWFAFKPTGALVMGVGDRIDPLLGGMTSIDLYRSTLNAGATVPSVISLSMSYGQASPPYNYYSLHVPQRIAASPDLSGYFLFSPAVDNGAVLAIPANGHGPSPWTVLTDVDEVTFLETRAGELLFGVEGANQSTPASVFSIQHDMYGGAQLLLPVLEAEGVEAAAVNGSGTAGFTAPVTADAGHLWRFDAQGAAEQMTQRVLTFSATLALKPSGAIAFSIGAEDAPQLFALWPAGGAPRRLQAQRALGFVLPN